MNEDDFEIDSGLRNGLPGVEQEDPALRRDEGKLEARERPGTSGEERVEMDVCAMSEPLF